MLKANGGFVTKRLAKADPAGTPQTHLAAANEGDTLVFGLHVGTVGAVVHKHEVFVVTLNVCVAA